MRRFSGVASSVFACIGLSQAGCGKTDSFTDAGQHDGAQPIDALVSGVVTVTAHSRCCTEAQGTPEAGIPVFTVQPDGTAGPTGVTGADGNATLSGVDGGAAVTVVYDDGENDIHLATVLAVQPGDHLTFGQEYTPSVVGGVDGTMTVTYPAFPAAEYYYAYHPCTNDSIEGGLSIGITEYASCQTPTADILLVAYDVNYNLLASGVLHDAPYTNGATVALDTWDAYGSNNFTVSVSGLESDVTNVDVGESATVGTLANYFENDGNLTPTGGSASQAFSTSEDSDRLYVFADASRDAQLGIHESTTFAAGNAATASMAQTQLPWLGQALVNGAVGEATWQEVGTGNYDGAVANLNWRHTDSGSETTTYYDWQVVIPPGVSSFTWANPPASAATYLPLEDDTVNGDVQLVDLAGASGYDDFRAAPEWQVNCPSCVSQNGELAGTSTVAFTFDGGEGFVRPTPTSFLHSPKHARRTLAPSPARR